ncbi:MAG: ATP-dependent DNA helicase, partial [Bacteroidetes bacterium]
ITSVDKIAQLATQLNVSLWEAAQKINLPKRTRASLDEFLRIIETARQQQSTANAYELAVQLAKRSKLWDLYRNDNSIEGMSRQENFQSLLNGIQAFVTNEDTLLEEEDSDKSLAAYLQNIALLTDLDDKAADHQDYVTLMSIHSAKGLEFKSVFVVGMEEKLFPSFMSMDSPDGLDEERRLFYVAITRAEQFLTLSYAGSRYRYGKMMHNQPSRFLEEIPAHHLESTAALSRNPARESAASYGPPAAKVSGNFRRTRSTAAQPVIDPKDFKPDSSDKIKTGMTVLHLKFGKGKVIALDNGIAHIHFKDVPQPDKKIMLKFAKLQILE